MIDAQAASHRDEADRSLCELGRKLAEGFALHWQLHLNPDEFMEECMSAFDRRTCSVSPDLRDKIRDFTEAHLLERMARRSKP